MQKLLKLGFLSSHNYLDKNAFSGTLYYIYKSLSRLDSIRLVELGNPYYPHPIHKLTRKLKRNKGGSLGLDSHNYLENFRKFKNLLDKQLKDTECDFIFAPVGAQEISCLETNVPIIYLSDTTFKLYQEFYQPDLKPLEIKHMSQLESEAITKAEILIYSSKWAADSAILDYKASPDKVNIIPFGANIDVVPSCQEVLQKNQQSTCQLLFVGKDWNRKGGEIAYQTLLSLISLGLDVHLTIVGCVPPEGFYHRNLTVIPYLNKNKKADRYRLEQLFLNSHFLLFPTRADCSPISICEANAFGLPVLSTDVGGIPSMIKNGENGHLFPLSASGDDYAHLINKTFIDKREYFNLVKNSKEVYEKYLNWNSWAEQFISIISQ
jgi:glycosyltransferase involved in cell wall biosynthesis